jgi:uncharacterized protein YeaO (DUF488 family)
LIKTKSVYSPIHRNSDGLRILATRIRGRGLPKSRYDVWMANLGPSERLLALGRAEKISWSEFARRYKKELFEGGTIDKRNPNIRNRGQKFTLRLLQRLAKRQTITLMCHCDEYTPNCHRYLLHEVLDRDI